MTTTEQENKELVKRLYNVINRDREAAMELCAEDLRWDGEVVGADGYVDSHWDGFVEPMTGSTNELEFAIAEDDMVAARWRYLGSHTDGEFMGIPPTGEDIEATGNSFFRIEDGEIAEMWAEWDFNAVFQALDLLPDSMYEIKIRQQLLEVLLRVLRHNIRNDLNTISGMAELISDGNAPAEEFADRIQGQAANLQATAEKVREIERAVVHQRRTEAVNLAELLGTVLVETREVHPSADISVSIADENLTVVTNPTVLSMVLEETIENAALHAEVTEPEIDLAVMSGVDGDYEAVITITDNGPGVPEYELKPLQRGREDPLEHGSGIGLWAIKWGMEILDGEVAFEEVVGGGTRVRLHLEGMDN